MVLEDGDSSSPRATITVNVMGMEMEDGFTDVDDDHNSNLDDDTTDNDDDDVHPHNNNNNSVDSKENPTQLYLRINYRLWDLVLSTLKTYPAQAQVWIGTKSLDGKTMAARDLPLHVACASTPTLAVVKALIASFPLALQCNNLDGNLPLHVACQNEVLLKTKGGRPIVVAVAEADPETLRVENGYGLTPIQLISKFKSNRIQQIAELLRKTLANANQTKATTTPKTTSKKKQERQRSSPRGKRPSPRVRTTNRRTTFEQSANIPQEFGSPSDLGDDDSNGIANQLNQLRMAQMTTFGETPSTVTVQKTKASPRGKPATGSKPPSIQLCLAHDSPPVDDVDDDNDEDRDVALELVASREADEGEIQFREQVERGLEADSLFASSDEMSSMLNPYSPNSNILQLSRAKKEVSLLRTKLGHLTEENFRIKSVADEKDVVIDQLKVSVDQERHNAQQYVKDLEMKLAQLQDQLIQSQNTLSSKLSSEQQMAKRISNFETTLASKQAENATLRAALQEEAAFKESIEDELESQRDTNKNLTAEAAEAHQRVHLLGGRLETCQQELEALSKADAKHRSELSAIREKSGKQQVQLRAMVEAKGADEKRLETLTNDNSKLNATVAKLKDKLQKTTDSFQSNVSTLENSLRSYGKQKENQRQEIEQLKASLEEEVAKLKSVTTDYAALQKSHQELLERQKVDAATLASVNKSCETLQDEKSNLTGELGSMQAKTVELEMSLDKARTQMEEKDSNLNELQKELCQKEDASKSLRDELSKLQAVQAELQRTKAESQQRKTKLDAWQRAMESCKAEIRRLVDGKDSDEARLVELSAALALLQSKFEKSEIMRNQLNAALEATRANERKLTQQMDQLSDNTEEIDVAKTTIESLEGSLAMAQDTIERLQGERDAMGKVNEAHVRDTKRLKVACESHMQEVERLTAQAESLSAYSELQASTIADLEVALKDLRAELWRLGEEYDEFKIQTTERDGDVAEALHEARQAVHVEAGSYAVKKSGKEDDEALSESQSDTVLHTSRDGAARLEHSLRTLRDEATLSDEAISALQRANFKLEEENKMLRKRVESAVQYDAVITNLAQINCQNLVRIKGLTERIDFLDKKQEVEEGRWESEHENSKERINSLSEALEVAEQKALDLEEQIENLKGAQESHQDSYDSMTKSLQVMEAENRALTTDVEKSAQQTRELTEMYENQVDGLQQSVAALDEETTALQESKRRTAAELALLTEHNKSLKDDLRVALDRNEDLQRSLLAKSTTVSQMATKLSTLEDELDRLEKTNSQQVRELQISKERELEMEALERDLESLKQENETLASSVQSTKKANDDFQRQVLVSSKATGDLMEQQRLSQDKVVSLEKTVADMRSLSNAQQETSTELERHRDLLQERVQELSIGLQSTTESRDNLAHELEQTRVEHEALRTRAEALERQVVAQRGNVNRLESQVALSEDLNKSYQIEVGRLLKLKTSLGDAESSSKQRQKDNQAQIARLTEEVDRLQRSNRALEREIDDMKQRSDDYLAEIDRQRQVHASLGERSNQKIREVTEMASKREKELLGDKEQLKAVCHGLEADKQKLTEDQLANSSNIEHLTAKLQTLDKRLCELKEKHEILLDEADSLRRTIGEQNDEIGRLERLVQQHNQEAWHNTTDVANTDWEQDILALTSRFGGSSNSSDDSAAASLDSGKKKNNNNNKDGDDDDDKTETKTNKTTKKVMDRAAQREALRQRVVETLEGQSSKIGSLRTELKRVESSLLDLQRQHHTLTLENKILKSTGRERDARAVRAQSKLQNENTALREAVTRLQDETTKHQQRIGRLATKQAALRRKTRVALQKNDRAQTTPNDQSSLTSAELKQIHEETTTVGSDDDDKYDSIVPESSNESSMDSDSLLSSLDDVGSIEVVLVDECRDDEIKT